MDVVHSPVSAVCDGINLRLFSCLHGTVKSMCEHCSKIHFSFYATVTSSKYRNIYGCGCLPNSFGKYHVYCTARVPYRYKGPRLQSKLLCLSPRSELSKVMLHGLSMSLSIHV